MTMNAFYTKITDSMDIVLLFQYTLRNLRIPVLQFKSITEVVDEWVLYRPMRKQGAIITWAFHLFFNLLVLQSWFNNFLVTKKALENINLFHFKNADITNGRESRLDKLREFWSIGLRLCDKTCLICAACTVTLLKTINVMATPVLHH